MQQQQQQPPHMIPIMSNFPPTNITTEQIQKCLDENKKLILAILENQNLGKLAECAQYQALLQKNLMQLAAIADAQPQAPTMPPQMAPHHAMQQGAYYMQHPQAAMAMAQQPGFFPPKMPLQYSSPHQMQGLQQQMQPQYQQAIQGQMAMQHGGVNNGMHSLHAETATLGGGNAGAHNQSAGANDGRGGNKSGAADAGTGGADGQGRSAGGSGGGQGPEEAK